MVQTALDDVLVAGVRDSDHPNYRYYAVGRRKASMPSSRCRRMSDSIVKQRSGYEPSGYVFAFSRRETPEFIHQTCPSKDRGRREGRVLGSHPRPVCIGRKHTVVTTGGAGSSGLPCAMVLTASFELSSVTSSFLPPSPRGLNGFTRPVGPTKPPRDLTPATGARTTRLRRPLQRRRLRAGRSLTKTRPAITSRADAAASTASRAPRP